MLFFQKTSSFITEQESQELKKIISTQEQKTSGEIRVCIESRCKYMDAMDRARELFYFLKMENTDLHNAALIYVAFEDRQFGLFCDVGLLNKINADYWKNITLEMTSLFKENKNEEGIEYAVKKIGAKLIEHFPFDGDKNKNELPDDIIFGK